MNLDEALYRFYAAQLMKVEPDLRAGSTVHPHKTNLSGGQVPPGGISSVPELIDFVRHQQTTNPKFLFLREEDLRAAEDEAHDAESFPEALPIDNRVLPLTYAYQPGQHDDGVTVRVTLAEAEALTPAALDWAVPGHLPEKVELMLKALPKEQRRSLIPLADTAQRLVRELALLSSRPRPPTLAEALAELLQPRLGVRIDPAPWAARALPDHLRVRVEVVDARDRVLCASRDLGEIQALLRDRRREFSQQAATAENAAWRAARAKWEGEPAGEWKFGDLPGTVVVEEKHGVPVLAHPGLKALAAGVAVRLFATPDEAAAATRLGIAQLLETQLRYDLGWLEKDLRSMRMLGALTATLAPVEQLQADALECIRRWVCRRDVQPLQAGVFAGVLAGAKQDLRGAVPKLTAWLKEILEVRLELQTHAQPYPRMADDLAALLPPDFLRRTPFDRLRHVPRYLRGMKLRADRWKRDTARDAQRAAELAQFAAAAAKPELADTEFRWLVEEFRVSLFAQDLGTDGPVSAVRLRRLWEELAPASAKPAPAPAPPPVVVAPAATKKSEPLKSLGALDQLFRK
jgi:ATP-dependent helicase HrpA